MQTKKINQTTVSKVLEESKVIRKSEGNSFAMKATPMIVMMKREGSEIL